MKTFLLLSAANMAIALWNALNAPTHPYPMLATLVALFGAFASGWCARAAITYHVVSR